MTQVIKCDFCCKIVEPADVMHVDVTFSSPGYQRKYIVNHMCGDCCMAKFGVELDKLIPKICDSETELYAALDNIFEIMEVERS